MPEKTKDGPTTKCACGCGRTFKPTRPWHRYATDSCRAQVWARAHQRRPDELELEKRIERLEAKLGIKPEAPGKGA